MIGRSGERGSGISVLAAHDDDDDDFGNVDFKLILNNLKLCNMRPPITNTSTRCYAA